MPVPKEQYDVLRKARQERDEAQSKVWQGVRDAKKALAKAVLAQMKDVATRATDLTGEGSPIWDERLETFYQTVLEGAVEDAYRLGLELVQHPLY